MFENLEAIDVAVSAPREPSPAGIRGAQRYAFWLTKIGTSCCIPHGQNLLNNMDRIVRAYELASAGHDPFEGNL